jgi:chromate transporter
VTQAHVDEEAPAEELGRLAEVSRLALKLGCTAFGGPAAHIAMLRTEVVDRRKWLSAQDFLDLLGATNLLPGPNSTEMVMLTGERRAGWRGLVAAGILFILPAACMVLALAWAYVRYGSTPAVTWVLYGIKPVIIAVVAQALWVFSRTAIKGISGAIVGVAVLVLYFAGVNTIALLIGGGLVTAALTRGSELFQKRPMVAVPSMLTATAAAATQASLLTLFLNFLKIGAVLYGSGYVLLAFLRSEFVNNLHWLTDTQLLDAVAIGQVTPGPVFTTATFVGYLVASWQGAVVATVGIFLPAFVYTAAVRPIVPRLRASPWLGAVLDGVNVAAVGLMAAVTIDLGRTAIVDALTAVMAATAAIALFRFKVNSVWLVLAGGMIGYVYGLAGG